MTFKKLTTERTKEIIAQVARKQLANCLECNEKMHLSKLDENTAICSNKLCPKRRTKMSIWKNTFFHGLKIPKESALEVIELWLQKTSINLISYILGVSKKAVWRVLKKVSKTLVLKYYEAAEVIGGNDRIIEIDESKFGKRKYNRGHHVEGVWVLGAVEKSESRRIRLTVVDDRSMPTLTNKIKEIVKEDSLIYTDCWRGYNELSSTYRAHETVNHSRHFKDPETGVHTNSIEGNWFGVKIQIPPRLRTKDKINLYLVRYMILRNEPGHPMEVILKYLF